MHEDVDGDAADGAEGGEHPQGVRRGEPEDVLALRDDDERLQRQEGGRHGVTHFTLSTLGEFPADVSLYFSAGMSRNLNANYRRLAASRGKRSMHFSQSRYDCG